MVSSSTGLVSGIDYNSLISSLRDANSAPITNLQSEASTIEGKRSALEAINSAMGSLQSAAEALSKKSTFLSLDSASSDSTVVMATIDEDSSLEAGSHTVKVMQLATANVIASQGVANATSTSIANATGKFTFSLGSSESYSIDVTSGMTLQGLADAINSTASSDVKATVVNDGTSTNSYRLMLTSKETGTANAIKITQNDTTLNLSSNTIEDAVASSSNQFNGTVTSSGTYAGTTSKNIVVQITTAGDVGTAKFKVSYDGGVTWTDKDKFTTSTTGVDVTGSDAEGVMLSFGAGTTSFAAGDTFTIDTFVPQVQAAQDCIAKIDGLTVNRSSNTIDDVIDGLTIKAKAVDTDTQTITITNSSSGVTSKVQALIDAYNGLVETTQTYSSYDTDEESFGILFGDSAVSSMLSSVKSLITGTVSGLTTTSNLTELGVTVDEETGKLELDSEKLEDALDEDLESVMNLFIESCSSTNSSVEFVESSDKTKTGNYTVNITTAAEQATVTGSQTLAGGLSADETLTVTLNDKSVSVTLKAGQTLDQVVSTLNAAYDKKELSIIASIDNGKLKLSSSDYGSDQSIEVFSNRDASASGQLGIGTAILSDSGVDVAGTINGIKAEGVGQTLTGAKDSDAEGLELLITATSPTTSKLTLSQGIGVSAYQKLEALTDDETGIYATKSETYDARIEEIDEQIDKLNDRLDAEDERLKKIFTNLEKRLSSLQSTSDSLTSMLSALSSSNSDS